MLRLEITLSPSTLLALNNLAGGNAATLANIEHKLAAIFGALEDMTESTDNLALEITGLKQSVAGLTTVATSAAALISGFSGQLSAAVAAAQAAGATPDQLQSLHDLKAAIDTNATGLAAAIALNTPAAPPAVFAVSPTSLGFTAGVASSAPLSFTGATGAVTVDDTTLPAGVTFDGTNLNSDDTTVAGAGSVKFNDESTPPQQAGVTVSIS